MFKSFEEEKLIKRGHSFVVKNQQQCIEPLNPTKKSLILRVLRIWRQDY